MSNKAKRDCAVIVIGAGHAGIEAALATARMGHETILLTMSRGEVARMPCNPAIGGLAKGQLVREIDALGGEMGLAIDAAGIQFRMLNKAKGPAVWSPRAQADKRAYHLRMLSVIDGQARLSLLEAEAVAVIVRDGAVEGVETADGEKIGAARVICALGTFPNGLMHIGEESFPGGRENEPPSCRLADQLASVGLDRGRLKTGTPARLARGSIDFSRCEGQPGDEGPAPFSFRTKAITGQQTLCHITYTNENTHAVIRENLGRSPLYAGRIKGIGPRYCPSIEDKVVRFAERTRHQLFLEPEGLESDEIYVNGLSTSLPRDVQEKMIRTIAGLESARVVRYGYAIEYDYFPPHQIFPTLESRIVRGLFFAGQVNGTSGYEEAAAQGIMAGINAALGIEGREPFILGRHQGYIGVLIDDLVTKEIDEPYRMFTSRAEHRLVLRQDNADERLFKYGARYGLLPRSLWQDMVGRRRRVSRARRALEKHSVSQGPSGGKARAIELLRRPGTALRDFGGALPAEVLALDEREKGTLETSVKYEGYIARQRKLTERMLGLERMKVPPGFSFDIEALSAEARQKLAKFRPVTLGQASRIAGVRSSDISILMILLDRRPDRRGLFHVKQPRTGRMPPSPTRERNEMEQWISAALAASGLEDIPEPRREKLEAFLGEVARWSEKIHLLGRGRLAENLRLQTFDSLLLLATAEREAAAAFATPAARLADIGSGAGFPGLVWKIARPEIGVVLFERRLKAHVFLERTIAALGLTGAEAREGDAGASAGAGSFSIVTSKAAGRLDDMLPIAERLLAPGGIYVTIKGASPTKELRLTKSGSMERFAETRLPEKRGLVLVFRKSG